MPSPSRHAGIEGLRAETHFPESRIRVCQSTRMLGETAGDRLSRTHLPCLRRSGQARPRMRPLQASRPCGMSDLSEH